MPTGFCKLVGNCRWALSITRRPTVRGFPLRDRAGDATEAGTADWAFAGFITTCMLNAGRANGRRRQSSGPFAGILGNPSETWLSDRDDQRCVTRLISLARDPDFPKLRKRAASGLEMDCEARTRMIKQQAVDNLIRRYV